MPRWKHNAKNRSVTYPEFFRIYLSMWDMHFKKKEKKRNLSDIFFQNFGKQDWCIFGFKNGRQMVQMFSIKIVRYQRIKYETLYELRTEKFKNTMLYYMAHRSMMEMEHSDWFLSRSHFSIRTGRWTAQMDRSRHALFCFELICFKSCVASSKKVSLLKKLNGKN